MAKASIAKKFTVSAASAAVLGVMSFGAQANETDIDFGGFVKLDMMVSDYTDGQAPSSGSIARQQYIPSLTLWVVKATTWSPIFTHVSRVFSLPPTLS